MIEEKLVCLFCIYMYMRIISFFLLYFPLPLPPPLPPPLPLPPPPPLPPSPPPLVTILG